MDISQRIYQSPSDTEKVRYSTTMTGLETSNILPYSSAMGGNPPALFCIASMEIMHRSPEHFRQTTSHLDPTSIYQVFRENWNDDADWLSLITWNKQMQATGT